jgi:uncharacterized membrane protein
MNNNAAAGLAAGFLGILCVVGIAFFVVYIFFLITLQTALSRCRPRSRTMEPGMVWLMFVPLFNFVWQFLMVSKVGDSLKREFEDRDLDDRSDYGKTLGLWWAATGVIGVVVSWLGSIVEIANQGNGGRGGGGLGTILSAPLSIASLVLMIVYWVKIAGYSKQLKEDDEHGDERDRRDDRDDDYRDDDRDVDDRPRRPSRPDDRIR